MTLMAMLTITVSATAMSFEQARREALFLTDKMAYELNLTDEQYEACYEINLDYLMGVTGRSDVFGVYWERRNLDLSYILLDWQWNAFIAASYFYRPLYWEAGYWHFGIYARYPHRDYFYFGRPHFYATYRGGHAWHVHGDRGYYYGHREHFRTPRREHVGMHDRWDRGDFNGRSHSSTRVTARPESRGRIENRGGRVENRSRMENRGRNDRGRADGVRRPDSGIERTPNSSSRPNSSVERSGSRPSRDFGSGSSNSSRPSSNVGSSSRPSRDFSSSSSNSPRSSSSVGSSSSRPSRSFGSSSSSRPSSSMSTSSAPSRSVSSAPSRSISSSPSRSVGSSHSGGGSSRSAGGHAGGRR